jgi:hypothetical protein
MSERDARERDILVASNEYAYVQEKVLALPKAKG